MRLVEVLVRIITTVKVMLANSVAELFMVPKHVELCLISSQVNHLILVCNVSFEGGSIILLIDAMNSLVFLISNNIMVVGMLALPCLGMSHLVVLQTLCKLGMVIILMLYTRNTSLGSLKLNDVLLIPELAAHLLSIYQLCKRNNCLVWFDGFVCVIQDKVLGKVLYQGLSKQGLSNNI